MTDDILPIRLDDNSVSFIELKAKKDAEPADDGHSVKLDVARIKPCRHWSILVDEELFEVECKDCQQKLNPIWVLRRFAMEESRMKQRRIALIEERKRWAAQSKTKCRKCGKFTELR